MLSFSFYAFLASFLSLIFYLSLLRVDLAPLGLDSFSSSSSCSSFYG